nr:hypothetical protein [Tanacetum cinerariifolium]
CGEPPARQFGAVWERGLCAGARYIGGLAGAGRPAPGGVRRAGVGHHGLQWQDHCKGVAGPAARKAAPLRAARLRAAGVLRRPARRARRRTGAGYSGPGLDAPRRARRSPALSPETYHRGHYHRARALGRNGRHRAFSG